MAPPSTESSSASTLLVVGASALLGVVLAVFGFAFGFGGILLGPITAIILSLFGFLLGLSFLLKGRTTVSKSIGGLMAAAAVVWAALSAIGQATGHG